MVPAWYSLDVNTLQNLWGNFLSFLLILVGAIIVFVIGWFISVAIGKLIAGILRKLKVDRILEKSRGLAEALEKAEIRVRPSDFIGEICKWILVIVFLMLAVDILGWQGFSEILREVINYLPNILIAVLIFVVTVILADIVEKVVISAIGGMKVKYASLMGAISKWALWIFAVFAIFTHLRIAQDIVLTLFQGLVAIIVIAGGIAFGLGGKEVAADILMDLRRKLKR
ncbi:hypothetical protein AMJ49_02800 [Parcubacteria bacterium DG_74_2]|nr:MAG: hypothetical protein AMJ49_02800 [Parcubacteria bacterium DG_74_2]